MGGPAGQSTLEVLLPLAFQRRRPQARHVPAKTVADVVWRQLGERLAHSPQSLQQGMPVQKRCRTHGTLEAPRNGIATRRQLPPHTPAPRLYNLLQAHSAVAFDNTHVQHHELALHLSILLPAQQTRCCAPLLLT